MTNNIEQSFIEINDETNTNTNTNTELNNDQKFEVSDIQNDETIAINGTEKKLLNLSDDDFTRLKNQINDISDQNKKNLLLGFLKQIQDSVKIYNSTEKATINDTTLTNNFEIKYTNNDDITGLNNTSQDYKNHFLIIDKNQNDLSKKEIRIKKDEDTTIEKSGKKYLFRNIGNSKLEIYEISDNGTQQEAQKAKGEINPGQSGEDKVTNLIDDLKTIEDITEIPSVNFIAGVDGLPIKYPSTRKRIFNKLKTTKYNIMTKIGNNTNANTNIKNKISDILDSLSFNENYFDNTNDYNIKRNSNGGGIDNITSSNIGTFYDEVLKKESDIDDGNLLLLGLRLMNSIKSFVDFYIDNNISIEPNDIKIDIDNCSISKSDGTKNNNIRKIGVNMSYKTSQPTNTLIETLDENQDQTETLDKDKYALTVFSNSVDDLPNDLKNNSGYFLEQNGDGNINLMYNNNGTITNESTILSNKNLEQTEITLAKLGTQKTYTITLNKNNNTNDNDDKLIFTEVDDNTGNYKTTLSTIGDNSLENLIKIGTSYTKVSITTNDTNGQIKFSDDDNNISITIKTTKKADGTISLTNPNKEYNIGNDKYKAIYNNNSKTITFEEQQSS